jgi:subtilisin family serine protease
MLQTTRQPENINMKKIFFVLTIIIFALCGSSAFATSLVPGEVLVKYKKDSYPDGLTGELAKIGWAKITVESSKRMSQVQTAFKKNPDILLVEPNTYGKFLLEPDDPYWEDQWYLPNIESPPAWDKSRGTGVIIGLIDSGVDLDHEDLADNILPDGRDFGDGDDDPGDELGHGTQVCGVIAAIQNNGIGISGIAPESMILPLKVNRGSSGTVQADAVAEAIVYAADYGAQIVNLSLGWDDWEPQIIIDAIAYAVERGVLLVAAAGNDYGPVFFPAKQEDVIAVSATDENNEKVIHYASGPEVELVAPGVGMRTTRINGSYTTSSGTSFASPLVSGVAALLLSQYPYLTGMQIRTYLQMRADDLGDEGRDDEFGYGKVDALRTLDPLISFVFPSSIKGSSTIPLLYLLAIFGDDTHFVPLLSDVSFDSDHLTALGPPIIALPKFLLQLVVLGKNPPEGFTPVTVVTGDHEAPGYGVLSIGRFPGGR